MTPRTDITDQEFQTHVWPIAHDEWVLANGNRCPESDEEWDAVDAMAENFRRAFDDGELVASWR